MQKKQTIAVDVDDVLSASAEGFTTFSNQRWGHQLIPDDYQEEWAEVWNVTLEEAMRRSDEFHLSGVIKDYKQVEGAFTVLKKLSKKYKLLIVTARKKDIKELTDQWLDMYFPGIFTEVRYAGIWDTDHATSHQLVQTKAEICRDLGADYLIDDQLKHCIGAAGAGITSLLFGTYRWNQTDTQLPENVIRVASWRDIARYFDV
jgi:5'(3')-deoxyribonucleotidase